jgi:hypothetical protein
MEGSERVKVYTLSNIEGQSYSPAGVTLVNSVELRELESTRSYVRKRIVTSDRPTDCTTVSTLQKPDRFDSPEEAPSSETGRGGKENLQGYGVVEESDGPWLSPIAVVRMKNWDLRLCVGKRK